MRIKLNEKYVLEREEICNELINILELDTDGCFILSSLDSDNNKQNKILEMKDKIKDYFAVSTISSFKPNFPCKRPYLNIIRSILRQQGYIGNSDGKIKSITISKTNKKIFWSKDYLFDYENLDKEKLCKILL
jgi:hypothetical protein